MAAVGHRGCGVGIRCGPGALGVLLRGAEGGPTDLCAALTGVFMFMVKGECHFINGTEKVRFVGRAIYNRQLFMHLDSDVGHFLGDPLYGEKVAKRMNNDPAILEDIRAQVDRYCRACYEISRRSDDSSVARRSRSA
uniref:MHC class II beta chain N-terminal domain-containing protein n=1 Tax=Zonotrichia albicollis TaxID=44394 RepID=A0A8D2M3R7_ZONAL